MCSKEGFYPAQKSIDHSLSATGILDAIGTVVFLFPALGFISAGAWSLDETSVYVPMLKQEQ